MIEFCLQAGKGSSEKASPCICYCSGASPHINQHTKVPIREWHILVPFRKQKRKEVLEVAARQSMGAMCRHQP